MYCCISGEFGINGIFKETESKEDDFGNIRNIFQSIFSTYLHKTQIEIKYFSNKYQLQKLLIFDSKIFYLTKDDIC